MHYNLTILQSLLNELDSFSLMKSGECKWISEISVIINSCWIFIIRKGLIVLSEDEGIRSSLHNTTENIIILINHSRLELPDWLLLSFMTPSPAPVWTGRTVWWGISYFIYKVRARDTIDHNQAYWITLI